MHISDAANAAETEAFRERVFARLGEHGALAGLNQGEAFKAIREI